MKLLQQECWSMETDIVFKLLVLPATCGVSITGVLPGVRTAAE